MESQDSLDFDFSSVPEYYQFSLLRGIQQSFVPVGSVQ